MTLFTEIPSFRSSRLRVDLSLSCLSAVDDFLSQFADRHSWTEKRKNRLRQVGEEFVLSLLEEGGNGLSLDESESGNSSAEQRRLVAAIRPECGSTVMEILVASDGTIQGNIEDRMAYLG